MYRTRVSLVNMALIESLTGCMLILKSETAAANELEFGRYVVQQHIKTPPLQKIAPSKSVKRGFLRCSQWDLGFSTTNQTKGAKPGQFLFSSL